MKQFKFYIDFPGELGAGLHSYTDEVTISVESGDPGGEDGEFEEHIKQALVEWFDGAGVSQNFEDLWPADKVED